MNDADRDDFEVTYLSWGTEELMLLSAPMTRPVWPASLTAAEVDVASHLLEGASYADIAGARRTSYRTVANQVASLFRKVGVCSRQELIVWSERSADAR